MTSDPDEGGRGSEGTTDDDAAETSAAETERIARGGDADSDTVDGTATADPADDDLDDGPTVPADGPVGRKRAGTTSDPPSPEETVDSTESVRETILDDVRSFFERAAADEASRTDVIDGEGSTPDPAFVADRWFDLSFLDDGELVEWQWVREPFSLVSVRYLPEERTYRYHVTEPDLDGFEEYVRRDLTGAIRNSLMYEDIEDDDRTAVFATKVQSVLAEHAATIDPGTVQKLYYYFLRDFLGYDRIDPLMRDGNIEDISCDGENVPVFIYHRRYRDLRTNVSFDGDALNSLAVRLAHRAGKHLSVSNPLVDASLEDGSRIQLTLGADISQRGTNFTIRKFSDVPMTPVDLIRSNTFSVDQMAYFWLAIENNMSLLFAGGTGSGKTTSLNAVSFFIPPDSKVVSIEDTREITLPHDNWVQSLTRESAAASGRGEVTTYTLLQAALRQRPEYILVGEIRTEQRVALTFFQAIGTGHTAYTTVHADTVESALARLRNPPLSVPAQLVQNLDIISVQRQVFQDRDRVRRNEAVAELVPTDDGDVVPSVVFERDAATDTHRRTDDSRVLQRVAEQRGWDADRIAIEESRVLRRVADQRGWDAERLKRELANRREVLDRLVDDEEADYATVARTIHAFARDPDAVLEGLRADDVDATEVAEVVGR